MPVSEFVLLAEDHETEIRAAGMPDWDSLILQQMSHHGKKILIPPMFMRVGTVPGEKFHQYIEKQWYRATEFEIDEKEAQFTIKDAKIIRESEKNQPAMQQNFFGTISGNIAGGDVNITNINIQLMLQALEQSVAESPDIPEREKTGLISKIKELANNSYISGLSVNALFEIVKSSVG